MVKLLVTVIDIIIIMHDKLISRLGCFKFAYLYFSVYPRTVFNLF